MVDYRNDLKLELIEQFREKRYIEDLLEVVGNEFQQVFNFFEQIRNERDLYSAVGKQLDGVGGIVGMTRKEAAGLVKEPFSFDTRDDEVYRQHLIYKTLKNTCDCTYDSMIAALKMFWQGNDVIYMEDPEVPATIILKITGDHDAEAMRSLMQIPIIRAAGVSAVIETKNSSRDTIYIGVMNHHTVESEFTVEPFDL